MRKFLSGILASSLILSMGTVSFAVETGSEAEGLQEIQVETLSNNKCGDDLTYHFNTPDGHLRIYGTGDMYNYTGSFSNIVPWWEHSKDIKKVTLEFGVTSISDYAFMNCFYLTEVNLPETLETIGDYAFFNCRLTDLFIPAGVTSIGTEGVFRFEDKVGSYNLADLVIQCVEGSVAEHFAMSNGFDYESYPSRKCGDNAYFSFDSATGTLRIYGSGDLYDTDPLDTNRQPWYIYRDEIKTVVVEDGITYVGIGNFFNFSNVETIYFADSVTELGNSIFASCPALQRVYLPYSIEAITVTHFHFFKYGKSTIETGVVFYGHAGSSAEKSAQEDALAFHTVSGRPDWAGGSYVVTDTYPEWSKGFIDYVYPNLMPDVTPTNYDKPASRGLVALSVQRLIDYNYRGEIFADTPFSDCGVFGFSIEWCNSNNIMSGTAATTFGTYENITREQFALILQKVAIYQGRNAYSKSSSLYDFTDYGDISSWATEGMRWAVDNGLMGGSDNKLNPGGYISRAEVAVMLYNYNKLYEK